MELSENPQVDILRFEKMKLAKARYDRYVCAVIGSSSYESLTYDEVADYGLKQMLAADKRWEEYMKGGEDAEG